MWTAQHDRHASFPPFPFSSSSLDSPLPILSIILIELHLLLLLLTGETNGGTENRSQISARKIHFSKRLGFLSCTVFRLFPGEITVAVLFSFSVGRPRDEISKPSGWRRLVVLPIPRREDAPGSEDGEGKDKVDDECARCGIRLCI